MRGAAAGRSGGVHAAGQAVGAGSLQGVFALQVLEQLSGAPLRWRQIALLDAQIVWARRYFQLRALCHGHGKEGVRVGHNPVPTGIHDFQEPAVVILICQVSSGKHPDSCHDMGQRSCVIVVALVLRQLAQCIDVARAEVDGFAHVDKVQVGCEIDLLAHPGGIAQARQLGALLVCEQQLVCLGAVVGEGLATLTTASAAAGCCGVVHALDYLI